MAAKGKRIILAIDPGNIESAFVLMSKDYKPIKFGKIPNNELKNSIIDMYAEHHFEDVAIEMIASYGMAVGASVFDTCVWIGRFEETAIRCSGVNVKKVFRKEVKLNLCQSPKAKDGNVIQALKDRFGDKGTKANPGFFYGFKADCWQAFAVGATWLDGQDDF